MGEWNKNVLYVEALSPKYLIVCREDTKTNNISM